MARTQLSDVWVPETFASYQIEDPIVKTELISSGIMVTNAELNDLASGPGFITTLPFWKQIDSSIEPNYSNDVYTDEAEPQKVETAEQVARVAHLNEGFSAADLVTPLSGKDPLKFVAAHVDQYWREQAQKRLIATAIGVYNDNVASNGGDMRIDLSSANNTVADSNRFGSTAFINAALTMGDAMKKVTGMAVHSMIYGKMLKDDEIEFIKDSTGSLEIPTYKGKVVLVDDGMPIVGGDGTTVAFKYLTILFGQGAFGYGSGAARVPSEYERSAARGNGGGFETLWSRKVWVMHPLGYKFTSTTITGPGMAPTWADLKLATNWERVVSRKNVPLAFLITNA